MTLVLIGKGLVLRGWPSKIEAKTGSIIPFWESSRCPRRSPWILFEKRCRAINYRRGKAIGDQLGNVYRKQEIKGKVVGFVDFWADEAQIEIHHPLLPNIIPYCQETQHVFFFLRYIFRYVFFFASQNPSIFPWSLVKETWNLWSFTWWSEFQDLYLPATGIWSETWVNCMGRGWGSEHWTTYFVKLEKNPWNRILL